jgi:hypothetical protein
MFKTNFFAAYFEIGDLDLVLEIWDFPQSIACPYLPYLLMKTLEYMLQKGGLKMSAEYALKQLGRVKYVVVTNPDGEITTSKLSIPSLEQRQIMDVLRVKYIKSET